ncbi:MAG: protein kinase [Planctomycetales bacterium]|nr:protein kinase [Planctomycetales bacterium]
MSESLPACDLSAEPEVLQCLTSEQKERLGRLLDDYLQSLERGLPPDTEGLLATDPDLAAPFAHYLTHLQVLHDVAVGFAPAGAVSDGGSVSLTAAAADAISLDTTALEVGATGDSLASRRLGDYVLGEEIGRGGMGVVYAAHQISLDRPVAIKLLPFASILDAKQIARFKNEAQAAAQLHHPHIVPVYAIGAERGVHYYVMQLIDGQPLDRAIAELRVSCDPTVGDAERTNRVDLDASTVDASRDLGTCDPAKIASLSSQPLRSPSARSSIRGTSHHSTLPSEYFRTVARLGVQAASALHAAHEYGVVHRDVKPSNLLLDGDGKVWVTDFGLARFQSEGTLTRSGDLVGTVRYMSPEQTLGGSAFVDHRADVYSLGATLYELLTLRAAHGEDGPALIQSIQLREPPRPRSVRAEIPRDLETIIGKAMSKDREGRYASMRDLQDDLQRFLDGRPTIARSPTLLDRSAKWAWRHRKLVGLSAVIGLTLLVGSLLATVLVIRERVIADEQRSLAVERLQAAGMAVEHFGIRIPDQLAGIPGTEHVRRELLTHALNYYRGFAADRTDGEALLTERAFALSKIGEIQRQLGDTQQALAEYRHAIQLYRRLSADDPQDVVQRRRLALCLNNAGLILADLGQDDAAVDAYEEAQELQCALLDLHTDEPGQELDLARTQSNLGLLCARSNERRHEAYPLYRASMETLERLVDLHPEEPDYLEFLSSIYNNVGGLKSPDDREAAIEWFEKALQVDARLLQQEPLNASYGHALAMSYNNLGATQLRAGRLAEAAQSHTRSIELLSSITRHHPGNSSYRQDLALAHNNLGLVLGRSGKITAAEEQFHVAIQQQLALMDQQSTNPLVSSGLGGIYNNLGMVLEQAGRVVDARTAYLEAVKHQRTAYEAVPESPQFRDYLSKHYFNQARVIRALGDPEGAARVMIKCKSLWGHRPQQLYAVAEDLAFSTRQLQGDVTTQAAAAKVGRYAIETLREVRQAGWPVDPEVPQLSCLRNLDGFEELIQNEQ